MSKRERRPYHSEARRSLAAQRRQRILEAAAELFIERGIAAVAIQEVAEAAEVSASSIYSIFKSKKGLLRELIDRSFPLESFQQLVIAVKQASSVHECLALSAKIARQIYDAEREFLALFTEAVAFDAEFQEVMKQREARRYQRQKETVEWIVQKKGLKKGLSPECARDLLWALTGRDLYRLFVVERGWSSDEFESRIAQMLGDLLVG